MRCAYGPLRRGILAIVLSVSACGRAEPPEAQSTPDPSATDAPQLVYRDINLTETDNDGRVLWKLEAAVAEYESEGFEAVLQDVKGEFYDPQGKAITIEATNGRVMPREKRLELSGNVAAVAEPLTIALTADRVEWRPEDNQLAAIGNAIVRHTEREIEMKGDRLDADLSTYLLRLSLDPSATSETPGTEATERTLQVIANDPPLDLNTQVLTWDMPGEVVRGEGGVTVVHREQQLAFVGDAFSYQIPSQAATLEGNVRATAVDRSQLDAERVQWDVSRAIAIATGNVQYRQPGPQNLLVRGQQGTVDLNANTISLDGSRVTTQLTIP